MASASQTPARAVPRRVLLAAPRGYCAGVDRAVQAVEEALELHGPPVYVRKEIVHNKHVVEQLAERGAIFVEEETEVPEGELVVFSAHGVAPKVHENARQRRLRTIDATCPLVTKVHVEARKFAEQGYTIVLIGHAGHEEVEGTTGEAPASIVLVQTAEDVDDLEVPDPDKVAYITQTTLSVDETLAIIARLRDKFPRIVGPEVGRHLLRDHQPPDRRQAARARVRPGAGDRLHQLLELEPPGRGGPRARGRLAPDRQLPAGPGAVAGRRGDRRASPPGRAPRRSSSEQLVAFFRERGAQEVSELRTVDEDVRFMLPKEIRAELAARGLTGLASRASGHSGGEADRVDAACPGVGGEATGGALSWRSWRGQLVGAGRLDLDRCSRPVVQRDAQRSPPVDARPGARPRRSRARAAGRRRAPATAPRLRAAREDLVAGRRDQRARGVAGAKRRASGSGSSRPGVERPAAPPGLPPRWPAYSPSPKWNQRSAPPLPQRNSDGHPSHP